MKKFLSIVLTVLFIGLVGLVVAAYLIPIEKIQEEGLRQVEAKTGLQVKIDGKSSISLFPSLSINVPNLTVNKKGEKKLLASAENVQLDLVLMDLIFKKVNIKSLSLKKPYFYLEIKKNGTKNWDLAPEKASALRQEIMKSPSSTSDYEKTAADAPKGEEGLPIGIKIDSLDISDGTFDYANYKAVQFEKITGLNLDVSSSGLTSKMKADARFNFRGQQTTLESVLSKADALYDNAKSDLALELKNNVLDLKFDGVVDNLQTDPKVQGDLKANTSNLTALVGWASGKKPLEPLAFTKVSRSGKVKFEKNVLTASPMTVKLDEATGNGHGHINLAGSKPHANVTLSFDQMYFDRFMGAQQNALNKNGDQIDKNNNEVRISEAAHDVEQHKSYEATAAKIDPKDLTIDLSSLNAINADYKIAIAQTSLKGQNTGKSDINGTLKNGQMNTRLLQSNFFKGSADVTAIIQNLGRSGKYNMNWKIANVAVNPLLRAFTDSKKLDGTAQASGNVAMSGATQRQLRQSMNGGGNFKVVDGAILGLNLAALNGDLLNLFSNPSEKTEFAELAASYVIKNGRLTTNDLRMLAPIIRMTGAGYVDFPTEYVDMKITPKVVATTKGQGGLFDVGGLPVPFRAYGPFGSIKFVPDLSGVIENVIQSPKDIIKNPKDFLKGLTGQGGSSNPPPANKETAPAENPLDALKGLFGK